VYPVMRLFHKMGIIKLSPVRLHNSWFRNHKGYLPLCAHEPLS
jgi:hypothetical protein